MLLHVGNLRPGSVPFCLPHDIHTISTPVCTVSIEMEIIRIFNFQEIVRTAFGYFLPP
jgi:hypothetical protein